MGATIILVAVGRLTKMAHFNSIWEIVSQSVARTYLENVWNDYGFPEDVVWDWDWRFTRRFFKDLYDYLEIKRSVSTASHPQTDGQTERINQVME